MISLFFKFCQFLKLATYELYENAPEEAAVNDFFYLNKKETNRMLLIEKSIIEKMRIFLTGKKSEPHLFRLAYSEPELFLAVFLKRVPPGVSLASQKRYLAEVAVIAGINLNEVIKFFLTINKK